MMKLEFREKALELKKKIDANQKIVDTIEAAGGLRTEIVQSDKIGFNWEVVYVNDILVAKVYVEQENPCGTEDNPIVWESGMVLIQNAYYIYGDERKVWTGEAGATADWTDENFVKF